jgi:hypothetical protein
MQSRAGCEKLRQATFRQINKNMRKLRNAMSLTQKARTYWNLKMRRFGVTDRNTNICRHAIAVAVCALTVMMFAGGAMAADWILGSTIAGTQSTGTVFYNQDVRSYDYGVLLGSNPTSITNTQGTSTTFLTGSTRATTYMANIFSALGTVNGWGAADNYTLGSGATVKALTTGTAASGQYAPTQNFNPVWPFNYVNTTWNGSIGAASATNAYAILTTGAVTLTGNNTIDGTASAANFNIGGSGVFFNGDVAGNLTYTAAGSATLSGGSDLTGSVNFSGWDGTLDLSNGSNVTGNIDTSGTRTGTLVFQNSSTVSGNVGFTAAIKEIQANGTGVVVIGGATNANTVNLNAAGTVAFTGGINTSLADGTLGAVNFNNYDGTVQIGANGDLTGNVTTATNTNGTLTFVSGAQAVTGQIGGSGKEIKVLNIGGTGTGPVGGIDNDPSVFSTTTITGHVFATSTVLNNNGAITNSELRLASGFNLTGTSVTTTDANMGVLSLMGGAQTVTASVGAAGANGSLNTVNSGANGAVSSFSADVFSVNVNNTGTGTSNFAANVTATNINVDNGISNFTNNVAATTTRIGTGVGNFNTNGTGTTTVTDLNFTGAGTANLYNGLIFTNLNYAGNNATVNVSAGKNLTGTAITTTTTGTGNLNMLSGNQTVNATVGAAGLALNIVNAGYGTGGISTTNFINAAAMYANTLNVVGDGTVNLSGGLVGNLNYVDTPANGTANFASGTNLTGNATTAVNGGGILSMLGGAQTVSGTVGAAGLALNTVNAGYGAGAISTTNFINAAAVYTNTLNVMGDGTVNLSGGLVGNLNYAGAVAGQNGTANIAVDKNLTGNVTTALNDTGILNLVGGTQNVTSAVGAVGAAVNTVNAGADGAASTFTHAAAPVYATTLNVTGNGTVNLDGGLTGNLHYADAVAGQNGTTNIAVDKNLTGNVTTALDNTGILNMLGGVQTVSGAIGAAGFALNNVNSGVNGAVANFAGDVFSINVNNTGAGTSNFAQNVTATNLNVTNGISNFTNNVTATTTTIGTGVGNFNTNGTGTTAGNIVFSADRTQIITPSALGSATANLYNGLTGNIDFASKDAVTNVWDGKAITGSVTSTGATVKDGANGVLNFKGAGAISGAIGADVNTGISQLNINTEGLASKTVAANGDIWSESINLKNAGVLTLAANTNIVGTTAVAVSGAQQSVTTDTANTGTLTLIGGGHTVTGGVGSNATPLGVINAGDAGVDTFNNTAYAQTLNFTGNGVVALNGQAGLKADGSAGTNLDSTNAGLIGVVDFGVNAVSTGTLSIGTGVNLTTGAGGINFRDANGATLRFLGTSTVTGEVGALATAPNTLANSTLKSIYAGAAGNTVTFKDNVHVSGNTFHVGAGTVNLLGDLYGPLLFDADGTVNVSNTKSIRNEPLDPTVVGTVKTAANNTGTLNYLGGTTLSNDIGENAPLLHLKAVNFHSDTTVAAVSQNIDKNIFATTTTIGNATTGTTANVTATGKFLGDNLTLAAANVTLNTAGVVAGSALSPVDFAHTKNADGTLTNTALVTDSTTGAGVMTTNGAAMNFAVGTAAYVAGGANGAISAAGSSSIAGGAGSTLVMNGTEKINVSLLGSTRNAESYALIDVSAGAAGPQAATLQDNSFVIDTALSRSATGDLVLTTSRDANTYVAKSGLSGHVSNAAATRLGALAASGTGYSSDMQTVLNKLDVDQWGYGNNQANLANQVKRLAPIANASGALAAFDATSNALYTVGEHLAVLRGDTAMADTDGVGYHFGAGNSIWLKLLGGALSRKEADGYDGFKTLMSGLVLGVDTKVYNGVIGLAGNYIASSIDQQDFRDGDTGKMNTWGVGLYGTQQFGKVYVDGNLGYAQHSLDSNRSTAVGRTANAKFDFKQISAKLGGGYRINLDGKGASVLTPILSVEYGNLNQSSYTETGAGALNLNVDSQTLDRIRGSLGLRFNTVLKGGDASFYPELMAAVNTQSMGHTDVAASFAGDTSGNTFKTQGVNTPNTTYTLAANLRIVPYKTIELQIGYRYEGGANLSSHMGEIRGAWAF